MNSYINLFDSASLSDVTPYIVTGGAMDGSKIGQCQEFEYASYDDIKHADTWPHPHFGYSINRYGFRTTDTIPNEIDIAAYGCSFTYGLGLPEDMNATSDVIGYSWLKASSFLNSFIFFLRHNICSISKP